MLEVELFHGPNWFSGLDLFMDLFSVIVLLMVAFFAWTYYRIDTKKKKPLFLFIGMASLAFAFLFKIFAYFSLYITKSELRAFRYLGEGVYQIHVFNAAQAFFFLFHAAIMIAGLFIIYSTLSEKKSKQDIFLFIFLLALALIFSNDTYISFNLISLVLLLLISSRFIETYKSNKLKTSKLLAISFFIVAISKVFFLLANVHQLIYVLAEFTQLAGFILLLFTLRLVLKNAKKTR